MNKDQDIDPLSDLFTFMENYPKKCFADWEADDLRMAWQQAKAPLNMEIARLRGALEKIQWSDTKYPVRMIEVAREAISESPASPKGVKPKEMGNHHAEDLKLCQICGEPAVVGPNIVLCSNRDCAASRYAVSIPEWNRSSCSTPVTSPPSEEKEKDWGKCHIESAEKGSEDYDRSIHSNPDAMAWAKFFCKTVDKIGYRNDVEWMMGWFANAMMAMHDFHAKKLQQENDELRQRLAESTKEVERLLKSIGHTMKIPYGSPSAPLPQQAGEEEFCDHCDGVGSTLVDSYHGKQKSECAWCGGLGKIPPPPTNKPVEEK